MAMAKSAFSFSVISYIVLLLLIQAAVLPFKAKAAKPQKAFVISYYTHQQEGVNEFSNVKAAVPPANGTSHGVGQQLVHNYPVTSGPNPTTSSPLGFKQGTSTVTSNSPAATIFHTNSVVQYNDPNFVHGDKKGLSGTFMKQGQANFGSGNPWEYAITGGTGDFSQATGFTVGRQVAFGPPTVHSAAQITTLYTTHIWLPA